MKSDKIFWISIVSVIVVMVILITQFAFRPHVIRLIKASAFQDPAEIGTIVHRQLQEVFRLKQNFEFRVASGFPEGFVGQFRRGLEQSAPSGVNLSFLPLPLSEMSLDQFPVTNERFYFWIVPLAEESSSEFCPNAAANDRFVGCLPAQELRYFERKKSWVQPEKWMATMTQFQMNQFVILVRAPRTTP